MAVIIGSARIDENGKATGGKAGDQTGKEVSTQNWYKQTTTAKKWRVFRPNDPKVAEKSAAAMQAACDNPNIGYDQGQRLTLYNAAKLVGFNPALVKSPVETDCSALVRVCEAYAGVTLPNFTTPTEPKVLLDSGAFTEMKGEKYSDSSDYLKRGDVLVTSSQGHTVIVLSNGPKAELTPVLTSVGLFTVGKGNWRVRSGPSTSERQIAIVKQGDVLPYLGRELDNWYQVDYKGTEGWISGKAGKAEVTAKKTLTVKGGTWYIRTAPDKTANKLGVVTTGDKLVYQGEEKDGWYLVIYKGENAWISSKGAVID